MLRGGYYAFIDHAINNFLINVFNAFKERNGMLLRYFKLKTFLISLFNFSPLFIRELFYTKRYVHSDVLHT